MFLSVVFLDVFICCRVSNLIDLLSQVALKLYKEDKSIAKEKEIVILKLLSERLPKDFKDVLGE